MPLAQVLAGEHVLEQGEPPVCQVLDQGHAAGQSLLPGADAVAEDQVEDAEAEDLDGGRHQPRVVLVVGVDHHDIVRAPVERLPIAGLLVSAVAQVLLVPNQGDRQPLGDLRGLVPARVVDHDHLVATVVGEPGEGELQGLRRIVGGHDYDGAFAHGPFVSEFATDRAVDHRPNARTTLGDRVRGDTVSSPDNAVMV